MPIEPVAGFPVDWHQPLRLHELYRVRNQNGAFANTPRTVIRSEIHLLLATIQSEY